MLEKVESYVREHYKKLYGEKKLFIVEKESIFLILSNENESPLILSKQLFT